MAVAVELRDSTLTRRAQGAGEIRTERRCGGSRLVALISRSSRSAPAALAALGRGEALARPDARAGGRRVRWVALPRELRERRLAL
eukprot:COSAG04_NODE_270_length_18507_cov_125.250380_1_plen_85_part_10